MQWKGVLNKGFMLHNKITIFWPISVLSVLVGLTILTHGTCQWNKLLMLSEGKQTTILQREGVLKFCSSLLGTMGRFFCNGKGFYDLCLYSEGDGKGF